MSDSTYWLRHMCNRQYYSEQEETITADHIVFEVKIMIKLAIIDYVTCCAI